MQQTGSQKMPDTPLTDVMLDTEEAAAFLRLSAATLISWRSRRQGPPYVKYGGRIFYVEGELASWRDAHKVDPSHPSEH